MKRNATAIAALAVLLLAPVGAAAQIGVWGAKGNDTGGIIPWSPENELAAFEIAQDNCGRFSKYAVLRSVHRVYGDYIVYDCRWDPPRQFQAVRHHRHRVRATIDK